MGKNKKEHRKKVAKRNQEIESNKKKFKKAQEDYLMSLIEREKAAGKFDKTPVIDLGEGPQI